MIKTRFETMLDILSMITAVILLIMATSLGYIVGYNQAEQDIKHQLEDLKE